jgi:putative glutamine amidotransferase
MKVNMLRVWIQGPGGGDIRAMLAAYPAIAFKAAPSICQSDMVLYTGGSDVNPMLYGQEKMDGTYCDLQRDRRDQDCFIEARKHNKFQVGICRGSQFLNVMCGGELWQDVNNHAGKDHLIADLLSKQTFIASSTHHQQAIIGPKGVLLAHADEATKKRNTKGQWVKGLSGESVDVEAFWYPNHRCLGVQWHPEWGPKGCTEVFFEYLERYRNAEAA